MAAAKMNDAAMKKVLKVKALSEGATTEGEAIAALTQLQKLLNKYGLSEADMASFDMTVEKNVDNVVLDETGKRTEWRLMLARVICNNFRCKHYISRSGYKSVRSTDRWGYPVEKYVPTKFQIRIVGLDADVELAKEAFIITATAIERLSLEYHYKRIDEHGPFTREQGKQVRASYIGGFISGLSEAFRSQVRSDSMELVLVRDPKVDAAYKDLGLVNGTSSSANYWGDGKARQDGHAAGKAFTVNPHRKVGGGTKGELNS